jgi:hypothetical protein
MRLMLERRDEISGLAGGVFDQARSGVMVRPASMDETHTKRGLNLARLSPSL